jgi:hypothetical protein
MVDKGSAEYKQSRCIHVLTKGKAKGECCGNKRMEGSDYCKSHTKLKKLTEPMSSAKEPKEPKPTEKK